MKIKTRVDDVHNVMVRMEAILEKNFFKRMCCYCREVCLNHTIRECENFNFFLQMMMDQGEIEFYEKIVEESINVIIDAKFMGESSLERPRPLTIFFEDDSVLIANMTMHSLKLTVEVPSLFPYMDNKMMPWNHNCNYVNEPVAANISILKA